MNKRSGKGLIRGAFLRLMFNNIFIFVAACACGVIDNLFVGRILGQDALAAVGFFSPVMTAAGLSYVLIMGVQVLSGNYVGEGKTELVNKLFVSVFFVLLAVFILINDFRCRSTGLANAILVRLLYQKRQLIAFASIVTFASIV